MEREEILAKLCVYDRRSPHFIDPALFGCDTTPERAPACGCDPCFRGTDRLALALLEAHATIDTPRADAAPDAEAVARAMYDAYRGDRTHECVWDDLDAPAREGWMRAAAIRSLPLPPCAGGRVEEVARPYSVVVWEEVHESTGGRHHAAMLMRGEDIVGDFFSPIEAQKACDALNAAALRGGPHAP